MNWSQWSSDTSIRRVAAPPPLRRVAQIDSSCATSDLLPTNSTTPRLPTGRSRWYITPNSGTSDNISFRFSESVVTGAGISSESHRGVVFGLSFARVLKNLIYDVTPADPLTFSAVEFLVIAIAVLAGYIPAE